MVGDTLTSQAGSQSSSSEKKRPKISAMQVLPGPAQYTLPGCTGANNYDPSKKKNPAYSFGTKTKQFSSMGGNSRSPGPVYFVSPDVSRTGKEGSPKYSLYCRLKPNERANSPGPAAYQIGNINPPREPKAPAYSFGFKLGSSMVTTTTPSPNKYELPSLVGSKVVTKKSLPAYTITGRSKTGSFHEDFKKTPGPGTYRTVEPHVYGGRTSPAYSLGLRCSLPSDNSKKPGPTAYSLDKVSGRQGPAYSFGVKHSDYIRS